MRITDCIEAMESELPDDVIEECRESARHWSQLSNDISYEEQYRFELAKAYTGIENRRWIIGE